MSSKANFLGQKLVMIYSPESRYIRYIVDNQ
jgi:hypothetical protein